MKSLFHDYKNTIGYAKIGGIGDSIQALFLSKALKRKYPDSCLSFYTRDKIPLLHRATHIDLLVNTGYCNWNKVSKEEGSRYDIFFDDRYIVGRYTKNKFKVLGGDKEEYLTFWTYLNNLEDSVLNISAKNLGIELKESDFDLSYLIQNNKIERITKRPYILIHDGHDKLRATKSYNKWSEVVELIRTNYDIDIFQIGLKDEPKIERTTDLRGLLNLEELCSMVRGAKLVLTQEGLLGHLCKGFNTKAIVLFGSTPVKCFGYDSNINIQAEGDCKECWYQTMNWYKHCPKKIPKEVPYCELLRNILPERIFKEVSTILV